MKKRICAVIMSLLLAVNLVGVPKAKAVATETALLGSIFGSLLVSMGYSWAADNMDVPTFGESIYKLTQEFDEAMKDTGNQLIRDLNLAGVVANGAGKLQFGYAWVQAARSFAEWFEGKFFTGDSTTAIVSGSNPFCVELDSLSVKANSVTIKDGRYGNFLYWATFTTPSVVRYTAISSSDAPLGSYYYIGHVGHSSSTRTGTDASGNPIYTITITQDSIDSGDNVSAGRKSPF